MELLLHEANEHGSLDAKWLAQFEIEIGATFPAEYRDFLIAYNGGRPEPHQFWVADDYVAAIEGPFYGIHKHERYSLTTQNHQLREFDLPEEMIAIADDDSGNYVCLGVSGPYCGKVYFRDHELVDPDKDRHVGFAELADSFNDFLGKLFTYDDDARA